MEGNWFSYYMLTIILESRPRTGDTLRRISPDLCQGDSCAAQEAHENLSLTVSYPDAQSIIAQ